MICAVYMVTRTANAGLLPRVTNNDDVPQIKTVSSKCIRMILRKATQ